VRADSGVYIGAEVTPYYDPMIAKLSVWGKTRAEAIRRLDRALEEYRIRGITTNLTFLRQVLAHPLFVSGDYDTGLIGGALKPTPPDVSDIFREVAVLAGALHIHRQASHAPTQISQANDDEAHSRWRARRVWRDLARG
jgi:acetyl-CoA carboxylase biotin carboxylase subunit